MKMVIIIKWVASFLLVQEKATKSKQFVILYPGKKRLRNGVTNQDIGSFHQFGTSKYTIKPKNAPALVFKTAKGIVRTKLVNHPGLQKREWFGITKKSEKNCLRLIELKIDKILRNAWP